MPYGCSVPRSPLSLAALATVALPGLEPVATRPASSALDFDVAEIHDSRERTWLIKAPRSSISGAAMEGEVALLENLAVEVDGGELPFEVPRPHGFAPLPEGGRAMVFPAIAGLPLNGARLLAIAGPVAEAIAAVHSLPVRVLAETGLPIYTASEHHQRIVTELDTATTTGNVPESLAHRWSQALGRPELWEFTPTIVHGDLSSEHILIDDAQVSGVIEWASAHVGDPAADLAPLLAEAPERAMTSFLQAYTGASAQVDDYLLARALFTSEFALVRWLLHGVRARDNDIIDDAVEMLTDLATAIDGAPPIWEVGLEPEHTPAHEIEPQPTGAAGVDQTPGSAQAAVLEEPERAAPVAAAEPAQGEPVPAHEDPAPTPSAASPGSGAMPLGGHLYEDVSGDDDMPTIEIRRGTLAE